MFAIYSERLATSISYAVEHEWKGGLVLTTGVHPILRRIRHKGPRELFTELVMS
jgi:hypothetical protein